jgi:hypothetical protein
LRAAGRILAGFGLLLAGLGLSVLALITPGRPTVVGVAAASLAAFLGFLGFDITKDETHPWRGARLALAVGVVLGSYLFSGLPWPPHGREWGATIILAGAVAASLGGIVLVGRAPTLTTRVVGVFAAYGVFISLRFVWYLGASYDGAWQAPVVLSFLMALSLGASWVAAFTLLVRARRQRVHAPPLAPAT